MKFGEKDEISIQEIFDRKPEYNEKYLKCFNGEITNFHNDKISKEGSRFICLSVILIDCVFRTGKNYYPQVLFEEFKYVVKEKKMAKYVFDDIEISSDPDR